MPLKCLAALTLVALFFSSRAHADPLTYDLEAPAGRLGGTLTGFFIWDSSITTPSILNATAYSLTYTSSGDPSAPASFSLTFGPGVDQADSFPSQVLFDFPLGSPVLTPVSSQQLAYWRTSDDTDTRRIFLFVDGDAILWEASDGFGLDNSTFDSTSPSPPWRLVLRSPVPEPALLLLTCLGATGVMVWRRRKPKA